ncbi:nitrogen regulation protein NR(II) [Thermodesulfobacteriota bacterium]
MVGPDLTFPEKEMHGRLQKLMLLRLLFVSLLLGASIFIQIKETRTYFGDIQTSHYILIAFVYFLTVIYIFLFKAFKNLYRQAYFQLIVDTFFITAIIYTTGGIESIFSSLYMLTIITGSLILYRKGGMIIASSCSILYGLMLDLHYYNIIHPFSSRLSYASEFQSFQIVYMIVVNITAFYVVAYLSSFISEQARKNLVELEAKQYDLVKLEALNEWIIQSITSGLITLDDHNRIILFNPAAEKIFGIKAAEAIGREITNLLPFLSEYIKDESGLIISSSKDSPGFIDLHHKREKGTVIFLRFFISPLKIPEFTPEGKILFFQDITEMKHIEEEMKKVEGLALIGELAAAIAHEIRNPMASISGSIEMLKESMGQNDVNVRLMDIVTRETRRLNHLVNDFLLFARPKPANLVKFDLQQLILESLELFKNRQNLDQKIHFDTDFQGQCSLTSDPEQIKQILWNIFLNAYESMHGGGLLKIKTESIDSSGNPVMVKITIRDTGPGFDENTLSHIFTPFFTTKTTGSGLGLAIVKRIVEALNGSIYGENHPDGGAIVTVLFPNNKL